jgi:sucrose 6(F)-phosphate phosphorylase
MADRRVMGPGRDGVRLAPQLMTYPDSLGGDLAALDDILRGPLDGIFGGIHILPPFPSSGDRGFAPLTYAEIDPRFGSWADIERLAERHDILLDVMINHISRRSVEFEDFLENGRRSRYADLFITVDKVWRGGDPPPDEIARIFLRKPDSPFSTVTIRSTGESERVWTSFGTDDWSEQIDLDVTSQQTRSLFEDWLRNLAAHGVRIVRLDAVGYVIKEPGTSCFMVEPAIYDFLDWIVGVAALHGLVVLPEVHDQYATHERLAAHGYWTYDFVLPGLLLHALETGSAARLTEHLARSPERQFTMLDCHDGIPVRPDLDGILDPTEMRSLADLVQRRGGNVNRILSEAHTSHDVDVHQLNCTYYSALDCDDDWYVVARAIQLFARGVPQIYYVGLLAGENEGRAVVDSGEGRSINRKNYTTAEVQAAIRRPVVQRLLRLTELRGSHPAFEGALEVSSEGTASLVMSWRNGDDHCGLHVDLASGEATITTQLRGEGQQHFAVGKAPIGTVVRPLM